MNFKKMAIAAGVALAGWYMYKAWRTAESLKLVGEPVGTQYQPAWSNPNAPKMGIGIDGKPALIYYT